MSAADSSPAVVIPTYPGSVPLNDRTLASPAGGSGVFQNWAIADDPAQVVAFFAERLGGQEGGAPAVEVRGRRSAWHLSAPNGGEHHVEVWPADAAYPFRDDLASPPPATARTVVHQVSWYRGARYSPPLVAAIVPSRWSLPPAAWLLTALSVVGVALLFHALR